MDEQLTRQLQLLRALRPLPAGQVVAGASPGELAAFQLRTGLVLPADLGRYFAEANGTQGEYDDNWFRFKGLAEFKSIEEELRHWRGSPDYSGIVHTLPEYRDCFVLTDWSIQCVTHAIRLHREAGDSNEVYAICGGVYGVVGTSFADFLAAYLSDWRNVLI